MSELGPWSDADFEQLSWHDAHIHGFHLRGFDSAEGSAELVLDIDFILKWESSGSEFLFTVCRADLRFQGVFGLKVKVDFASGSAGMCPFVIDRIDRELPKSAHGHELTRWSIPLNWPEGQLEFQAHGFNQVLTGQPVVQRAQWLTTGQRERGVAA